MERAAAWNRSAASRSHIAGFRRGKEPNVATAAALRMHAGAAVRAMQNSSCLLLFDGSKKRTRHRGVFFFFFFLQSVVEPSAGGVRSVSHIA